MELAKTLIKNLEDKFDPQKHRDTYREKVEALIAAKLEGKETVRAEEVHRPAPVTDITEALRKSLALIKKPPKPVETKQPRAKQSRVKQR